MKLIQTQNDDLKVQIQQMSAHQETKKKMIKELQDKSNNLSEEKIQLKMHLMELQIDNTLMAESAKKYNTSLVKLQQNFNSVVDPFNAAKELGTKNKESYQKVAKVYNEQNKKIDGYKDELNQKGEMSSLVCWELFLQPFF